MIALILGALILHERVTVLEMLACVLLLAGAMLSLRDRKGNGKG